MPTPATPDAVTVPSADVPLDPAALDAVLDRAVRRIAPLWPLEHFVAVNPWFGLADHDFESAARRMATVAGARTTMPRSFYAERVRDGRITDVHLAEALERARRGAAEDPSRHDLLPRTVEAFTARFLAGDGLSHATAELLPTVTDVVGGVAGTEWTRFATERISHWAAGYFDRGQAGWATPFDALSPFEAWRAEARLDRTPEVMGVSGFRAYVAGLPDDPREAAAHLLHRLDIPDAGLELYLHRLLMTVSGWSGWTRYAQWEAELHGGEDDTPIHLLAIRLAWEGALLECLASAEVADAWTAARRRLGGEMDLSGPMEELQADLVLHQAFELAWQEDLIGRFDAAAASGETVPSSPPDVQAAFCIDVRSEVFRRALEAQDPGIRTLGFAGFFGFPLALAPLGSDAAGARCPVLLTPAARLRETVAGDEARTEAVSRTRAMRRTAAAAWKSFKMGAVSCFGFVGPVGLAYAAKLLGDGFGLGRPVSHPSEAYLAAGERRALAPDISGLPLAQRVDTAEGALRGMGLTDGFAPVVLLAGHGSTTVNNPHATGLDCGACGGHTGEVNARVAVAVLNDPSVRVELAHRGIRIPDTTWFVAGLHDTTTDRVTLFDLDRVPATLRSGVDALRADLEAAGRIARAERVGALDVAAAGGAARSVEGAIVARSRDWSQVRPEWGLAGCAAFVAAPRHRTAGMDLRGRSFLHDYAWETDEDFGVLELIMTAPMVVASWISLQYYGSTVDNDAFGAGNKVLHNVVGTLGVFEGNGGDLRTGLPLQSVHDGAQPFHDPLRLNVVIEAPREAMNRVIEGNEHVRHLLDHGWLTLWQMDGEGRLAYRYERGLEWSRVDRRRGGAERDERAA